MIGRSTWVRLAALSTIIVAALLLLVLTFIAVASSGPKDGGKQIVAPTSNGAASWSSGWASVPTGTSQEFVHGLGRAPENYAVEMWFWDLDDGLGINRRYFGGADDFGDDLGAYWHNLTTNTIRVYHGQEDTAADVIRVRVWVIPAPPDNDSGWLTVGPGETHTFAHGLAVTATDLTVGMWFSSSNVNFGIHNQGYGGLAFDDDELMTGVHWHNLTSNTVQVSRHPDDLLADQIRIVVVHGTAPDYDSRATLGDWRDIVTGTNVFTHNLNWSPELMTARAECYGGVLDGGIHQQFAGGNHDWFSGWQGANIQNLTTDTITVYRQPDDLVCPQARIRIWKRRTRLYLPLIAK